MSAPRFEFKYRIDRQQFERVEQVAEVYLESDEHSTNGSYSVNSLYFDTGGFDDAHEMDEGIALRSKVRLRCYHRLPAPPYFLELKQRFGTTITKSRAALSERDAERIAAGRVPVDAYRGMAGCHALDGIREVIDRREMEPRIWVNYTRSAYVSPWGDGSRLTFDRAVESQPLDPSAPLAPAPEGWAFPDLDERAVLELKFLGSAPGWMQQLAHECSLQRVSVSKYGLGFFSLDRSPVIAGLVEAE